MSTTQKSPNSSQRGQGRRRRRHRRGGQHDTLDVHTAALNHNDSILHLLPGEVLELCMEVGFHIAAITAPVPFISIQLKR